MVADILLEILIDMAACLIGSVIGVFISGSAIKKDRQPKARR